jgi:hypothetical protein
MSIEEVIDKIDSGEFSSHELTVLYNLLHRKKRAELRYKKEMKSKKVFILKHKGREHNVYFDGITLDHRNGKKYSRYIDVDTKKTILQTFDEDL